MADGSGSAVLLDPTLTGAVPYTFADSNHNNIPAITVGVGTTILASGFVPFDGPVHPVLAWIAPGGLSLAPGGGGGTFDLRFIVGGTLVFASGVTGPFSGIIGAFYGAIFFGSDPQLAAFTPGAAWSIELVVSSGTMVVGNISGYVVTVDGGVA